MAISADVSTKCKYALHAVLELALSDTCVPVKTQRIASAQGLPLRFLEIILAELRQAGFVASKRGNDGGYFLARPAHTITIGEVIRFIEGHGQSDVKLRPGGSSRQDDSLAGVWKRVKEAVSSILDTTTFADLAWEEMAKRRKYAPDYAI